VSQSVDLEINYLPLRNPKFRYRVHNSPPLDPILTSWMLSKRSHSIP